MTAASQPAPRTVAGPEVATRSDDLGCDARGGSETARAPSVLSTGCISRLSLARSGVFSARFGGIGHERSDTRDSFQRFRALAEGIL